MSSITEDIEQLLNQKVSFQTILNKREIWDRGDAQNIMRAAITNLKRKKKVNLQHVEAFEGEWEQFINSTEADTFFATQQYKQNIILEHLADMNYRSHVKRNFIDNEERIVKKHCTTSLNTKSPTCSSEPPSTSRNIWSIWTEFIDTFFEEEVDSVDINPYSLEYLGIIQVGKRIGNNQSRTTYPPKLLQATNNILKGSKDNVFLKFNNTYKEWFNQMDNDVDECHTLLLRNAARVKATKDITLTFCYEFFMIFVTQVFTSTEITEQESTYNHKVIWRFFDTIKLVTPYCKFIPGETRLQAIKFELKRRDLSLSSYYNADGILLDKTYDIELVILETTGPFGLKDTARETTDHVKAAYGLLAMIHQAAYSYIYADADIFLTFKVYFIHAARKKIRLWSFGLVSKELYVLNRIQSAVLPIKNVNSKEKFEDITNMMWELKANIDFSHEILKKIKESHEKNKRLVEKRLDGYEKIKKLDRFLAENAEVKLSSRVSEAENIYVYSSPLGPSPDSPLRPDSPVNK